MRKYWLMGWIIATAVLAALPGDAQEEKVLFQATFAKEKEMAGWAANNQATVSDVTRRQGTRSLLIRQWKDAEQDSQWLSPVISNPGAGAVKISFWAADDYRRQADFSYAASLDTVTVDGAGKQIAVSDYLTSIAWDDSRKWDELWGKLAVDGLVWKYYEVVTSPGASFRLKYHWPKPLVLGDCYLTDILVTQATAADAATAAAPVKAEAQAQASGPSGNLRLELSTPVKANLYYHDDPLQFEAFVYSSDKTDFTLPPDAKLTWEISDFQASSLARGELPFADARPVADPAFYKSRVLELAAGRSKNVTKSFVVEDPNAKMVGQELFIEVKLLAGGKVLAAETMPYGVVNPRPIDPRDYGKLRFIHEWWSDGIHFAKSKHERQSLADKLGVGLSYGHAPSWKAVQPTYPGPYTFGAKWPAFPQKVLIFNLEQERRQKADAVSWGRTIQAQWESMIPAECIIDDPLHPGCPTFQIEPYVEFIVATIRHQRASIAMVVASGLERPVDARTIELQKKVYTAIKKEFPELPVGHMIYGLFMNPSEEKRQFVRENLFDYADFIDNHLYASGVDWTEWEDLQQQFEKRGKKTFLISTEMAIVSGADHVSRARGTIMGCLDVFAHNMKTTYYFNQANHYSEQYSPPICRDIPKGSSQTLNFLHMQMVARPKVSPDIVLANGSKDRWGPFEQGGGTSYMPVLQTIAYYNTVQNYEATDFRETRRPDADSAAQVFDRRDATVVGLYMTKPVGFRTYAVKTDTGFTMQDMFGRNTHLTPLNGVALISFDENPTTLIFDKRVETFAIEPINGGMADATIAKGGTGQLAVTLPAVFSGNHSLRLACVWAGAGEGALSVKAGKTATATLPIKIGAERMAGQYPLRTRLLDGEKVVGLLGSSLEVTELLRLEVTGLPLTATTDPAIEATIISLEEKPVTGVVSFDNRYFTTALRHELQEIPFQVPARGQVKVRIPVRRELVNLATAYEVPVTVRTADGKQLSRTEEVAFRACERAPGKIVIDGDLADWQLAERTPFSMEREFASWGKEYRGPDDLSAKVYTLWDDKAIYFAAVVKDDSYVNNADDIGIWFGDNIAFGFHPWGWKLGSKINTGYYREHLGLCKDGVARIFRVGNPTGGPAAADGASIAVKKVADGFVYEWAYPRECLFPMELAPGKRFRLSMGVWDMDWVDANGEVVREKPAQDASVTLTKLGGLNFASFLANVDSRPEKWREFVLTK
jgi:hypothetical protein